MKHRGTITTQGFIPFLRYKGMDLAVKAKVRAREGHKPCSPVTHNGFIVYALPGGWEYVSDMKITEVKEWSGM